MHSSAMPNFLLYHAVTPDEVHACAWSLIRYLNQCNLKPPAEERLVIYTNQPAALENYSAFFNQFEFREPTGNTKTGTVQNFCSNVKGNVLFFGPGTYPTQPLRPVFESIQKGNIYGSVISYRQEQALKKQIAVLGINTELHELDLSQLEQAKPVTGFAEQYHDLKDFPSLLKKFFTKYQEESVPELVKLSSSLDLNRIRAQKTEYMRLPFYKKITRKLTGKSWNIADYVR